MRTMNAIVHFLLILCATDVTTFEIKDFADSDTFMQSLLSEKLGKSNDDYKILSRIQNGAFELLSTIVTPLTPAKEKLYMQHLEIAAAAGNTEKVNELLGKILYTIQSTKSSTELTRITTKYVSFLSSSSSIEIETSGESDYFDPIYYYLKDLEAGKSLIFAIDTTGSMFEDIQEAKTIALDIIDIGKGVSEYILSPFSDPKTGPLIKRLSIDKEKFQEDIGNIILDDGGDCAELAFKGMLNAFYETPEHGSSMFVFTDAAPKDGSDDNFVEVVDTASLGYNMKVSFFLDKNICGSTEEIEKFHKVADETGGNVFILEHLSVSSRKRRSMTTKSKYSPFVSSSLSGSSLITSGQSSHLGSSNSHTFDIDEYISVVYIVVTIRENSPRNISVLIDPFSSKISPTSKTSTAVIFEVANPVVGRWTLRIFGNNVTYNFKVSAAFKEPIAFNVRYFYEERPRKFIMIERPLLEQSQSMLIDFVGGDKIDASSIKASFVDIAGNLISTFPIKQIGSDQNLKFSSIIKPKNLKPYRIKVTGKTKNGSKFERTSEQPDRATQIAFKTVYAGDELSAIIGGSTVRIMTGIFIKNGLTETVNIKANSTKTNNAVEQSRRVRSRGFFFLKYIAPKNVSLRGQTDYFKIQASYGSGRIATYQIPILLV